jgi:hypothetical protein
MSFDFRQGPLRGLRDEPARWSESP